MEYYKIINNQTDSAFAYYNFSIKWNIENILKNNQKNGFLVQEVIFTNTTEINVTQKKEDNEYNCYYEAWEIKNRIAIETRQDESDDTFSCFNEYDILSYLAISLGKIGEIKYETKVYWIDEKDKLYDEIKNWNRETVPMANGLKSIYKRDFSKLKTYTPIFERPNFVHKINFKDKNTILDTIRNIFKVRIKNKDESFLNELKNEFKDTDYKDIIQILEKDFS